MLRSADQRYYEVMKQRFITIAEAAAAASDVTVDIEFSGGATTMVNNAPLARRWVLNAEAYGIVDEGPNEAFGSTDMANVSWVVPAIHPDLAITEGPTPGHSIEFRDAAARPLADQRTLLAATLVAQTAVDLLCSPELVETAWAEFRRSTADG